jgi:hypothetical protein
VAAAARLRCSRCCCWGCSRDDGVNRAEARRRTSARFVTKVDNQRADSTACIAAAGATIACRFRAPWLSGNARVFPLRESSLFAVTGGSGTACSQPATTYTGSTFEVDCEARADRAQFIFGTAPTSSQVHSQRDADGPGHSGSPHVIVETAGDQDTSDHLPSVERVC